MNKSLLGLAFCLLTKFVLWSHNLSSTNYTVDDGLTNNTIYHVMQDSKGFIWCSTASGVSRFDGKNWDNFYLEDGLGDNENFKSYEDSKCRIWFLSSNGTFSYFLNGEIHKVLLESKIKRHEIGMLFDCLEDKKNDRVYFITSTRKLFYFDNKKQKIVWKQSKNQFFILSQYKNEIYAFSDIFFNNDLLATCLSSTEKKSEYFKFSHHNKKIRGRYFIHNACPILLENNCLLFLTTAGVFQAYNGRITSKFPFFKNEKVNSSVLLTKFNQRVYIGGGQGLFELSQVNPYFQKPDAKLFFGDVMANYLLVDDLGNFWIATHNKGLIFLPKNYKNIKNITVNSKQNETYSVTKLNSKELLIGLLNGNFARYDFKSKKMIFRKISKLSAENINRVKNIFELKDKTFYLGDNLFLVENSKSKGEIFRNEGFYKTLKSYCLDRSKTKLWLASSQFLYEYDINTNSISDSIFFPKRCNSLAFNKRNELYVGSIHGLYKKSKKNQFISMSRVSNLFDGGVLALVGEEEQIWVATQGSGIILLDNDEVLFVFNKKNGLISNNCQRLVSSQKHLFACTSSGLSIINKETFETLNLTVSDGLMSNDVRDVYFDEKKNIYLATDKGVCFLNWKDIVQKIKPPQIYLRDFQVNDSLFSPYKTHFKFLYKPSFLSLQFAAISFYFPQILTYNYRLKGDLNWQVNKSGNITFYNLPPGNYEIEVRAKQYKSNWSKILTIKCSILPRWHQKTSVQLFIGGGISLIIGLIIYWRLDSLRKRERENHRIEVRINELERRALAAQMNPHFIFNSLNTLHQLVMDKETENALNYLNDFSKLVRQILSNSRKPVISIHEEMEFLNNYLIVEKVRYNDAFNFEFSIDGEYDELITIPPMLIQPIIENAIKYGVSTATNDFPLVKVSIKQDKQHIVFCIEDNGSGIEAVSLIKPKDKLSQSNAMAIIVERLNLIEIKGKKGWLEIESESKLKPTGTKVRIYIPI